MPLQEYLEKRNFTKSPEPTGKKARVRQESSPLHFVIQRHEAHHLHYDLRLELNGVLKSWAIPKGLTLDPEQKKLAIMVEDHPLDYLTFEGVIPKGSYGAGTTIIWDEGEYHWAGATGRRESEKAMNEGLLKGHISFVLQGGKLNGEFALVRLKRAKENNWLLIKKHDEFSHPEPPPAEKHQKRTAELSKDKTRHNRKPSKAALDPDIALVTLGDVPVTDVPPKISPMLATLIEKPFDREGWFFEIKWDGYRAVAEIIKNNVRLYSRNDNTLNDKFPALIHSLEELPFDAVLDGEVVVLDSEGRASFKLLQNHLRTGDGVLAYYVFDVLYLNGHDLRNIPLRRRKHILSQILPDLPNIRVSEFIEEKGISFFRAVQENGVEGMLAKNGKSIYQPGTRSREWLKIKNTQSQEAVIGGYTAPRGGRRHLGSLLLGVYEDHDLVYIGRSGGGFTENELSNLHTKLAPLKKKTSPFKSPPKTDTPVTWVKPEMVCEVRFSEWTDDGLMREPVFLGLREDIPPFDVRREKPEKEIATPGKRRFKIRGDKTRITIEGADLDLTNLEKVFWPDEGYTKGDMINYYRAIAPVILPHLKDRPESMHRFPNGITGQSFFQKNVDDKIAPWIETIKVSSGSEEKEIRYLLCQDEASLVYMANLGCIELHTWNSRYRKPDNPDYLVLDIDPLDIDFHYAVEAALATREVIELAGAKGFCKTSGATGLHIYIPVGAKYTTEQVQQFAQLINLLVHERLPKTTSLERPPVKRPGRVYLDYLQNRRGATMAAPYCIRPRKGAPVSAPLHWEEVNDDLNPANFHIKNMVKRVDKVGDIWQGVLRSGINMEACLKRLSSP